MLQQALSGLIRRVECLEQDGAGGSCLPQAVHRCVDFRPSSPTTPKRTASPPKRVAGRGTRDGISGSSAGGTPELEVDHPALPFPAWKVGVASIYQPSTSSLAPSAVALFRHPRLDMRRGQDDAPSPRLNRISTALPPAPRAIRSQAQRCSRLAAARMLVKTSTAERRATAHSRHGIAPAKEKTSSRRWAVPSTISSAETTLPPLLAPPPIRAGVCFVCVQDVWM